MITLGKGKRRIIAHRYTFRPAWYSIDVGYMMCVGSGVNEPPPQLASTGAYGMRERQQRRGSSAIPATTASGPVGQCIAGGRCDQPT